MVCWCEKTWLWHLGECSGGVRAVVGLLAVGLVIHCACLSILMHLHVGGIVSSVFFQQIPQTLPQLLICVEGG